ncbi:MAG: ZIP family metal transporter [Candidatus Paceibacterota bacterium]|jgi:ZIP family zinc transporter
MLILIAIGAFVATILGGLFAIRFRDKLHLILGFSAGAVLGVAFFDLLPEAISLGNKFYEISYVMGFVALGFIFYLILDRLTLLHCHDEGCDHGHSEESKQNKGVFGAISLSVHSFLDGVAVGIGFQVSVAVGVVIAVAVLVHDFSDGLNTASLILRGGGEKKKAFRFLIIDALAPVLGIFSTFLFILPEKSFSIILALFAGFFLYIGASDLLPESHHAHPKIFTTIMTLLGMGLLYLVISLTSF